MLNQNTLAKISESAPVATYGGAGGTILFWGLHLSEVCAIISTLVAILGLVLQVYVAMHRIRRLEKGATLQKLATNAVAQTANEAKAAVEKTTPESH